MTTTMRKVEKLKKCYESVAGQFDLTHFRPAVAIVLGSGLGEYAKDIQVVGEVDYHQIEEFPVSTVPGHAGKFIFGYVGKVPVVCMQGRVHYYEGYAIEDVVLPIRLMKQMGASILFLTNASGGINPAFGAGDLMLIKDHISLFVPNPLIGENVDAWGTRFPDMSYTYTPALQAAIKKAAAALQIPLQEGVYVQLTGPSFESPAEIALLGRLGADAVGMSTVVEAIAARHMGMEICGISFVSNPAAGISKTSLSHEEVQAAAAAAAPRFKRLVTGAVEAFAAEGLLSKSDF